MERSATSHHYPRVGSALLVVDQDQVLLGRRNKDPNRGKWVLPGGKVEPFESIRDAGRRELLEETGLDVKVGDQIGVFEIIAPPNEHRLIIYSWAAPVGGALRPATDISELRFVSRGEAAELELTEVVRAVLERVSWLCPPKDARAYELVSSKD